MPDVAYHVALYLHLLSLFVLIGAITMVGLCYLRLRVAESLMDAAPWVLLADHVGWAFPVAILGLFASGAYLTTDRWSWSTPWIVVSIGGLILDAVQGPDPRPSRAAKRPGCRHWRVGQRQIRAPRAQRSEARRGQTVHGTGVIAGPFSAAVRSVGRRGRGRVDVGILEQRVLFATDLAELPPGGKSPSYVGVILGRSRVGDAHDLGVFRLIPGRSGTGDVGESRHRVTA